MKMVILKILGGILILAIVFRINSFRNWIDRSLLSEEISLFPSLDESPESQNYQIEKILRARYISILTDKINGNSFIRNHWDGSGNHELWKINEEGIVLDSIEGRGDIYASGVYFYDDYCIDWAVTGNKEAKYYDPIIDYDSLTEEDFTALLNKASIVDFKKDYGHKDYKDPSRSLPQKGRCYIKIEDKWLVIESEKMFEELSRDYNEDYYTIKHRNHKSKGANRLTELRCPFGLQNNSNEVFNRLGFVRKHYSRSIFFRFTCVANGRSRGSGWNGMGYYVLRYKSENINFKLPTFQKTSLFGYEIRSYDSEVATYYKDDDMSGDKLLFIVKDNYHYKEIYVVKKK